MHEKRGAVRATAEHTEISGAAALQGLVEVSGPEMMERKTFRRSTGIWKTRQTLAYPA